MRLHWDDVPLDSGRLHHHRYAAEKVRVSSCVEGECPNLRLGFGNLGPQRKMNAVSWRSAALPDIDTDIRTSRSCHLLLPRILASTSTTLEVAEGIYDGVCRSSGAQGKHAGHDRSADARRQCG
jgi:hypothetical protein